MNHVSLTPLTPRFPIDDDVEPGDYFSPRVNESSGDNSPGAYSNQHRTSYLSSYSVPGTPGVLSHSRSESRHIRSKSSSRTHLSDTNLQSQDVAQPIHHSGKKKRSVAPQPQWSDSAHRRSDSEWMLRAGIALASSTREEKGQSWLAKRESSTSLVSETYYDTGGRKGSRRSRSGMSTPAANTPHSRRGSRSLATSRRGSRPDLGLTMTGIDVNNGFRHANSNIPSPAGDVRAFVPDFVDERIRAEMASIQGDESASFSSEYSDSEDEIDELELQKLTRERGFGLGSWIDRVVEWTLFGTDEGPPSIPPTVRFQNQPSYEDRVAEGSHSASEDEDKDDGSSVGTIEDNDSTCTKFEDVSTAIERPGEQGGWEDAGWLFRVAKRALLL